MNEAETIRVLNETLAENARLRQAEAQRDLLLVENQFYRSALELIANSENPEHYAVCLPDCVEGPPTCGCAERRARTALLGLETEDAD